MPFETPEINIPIIKIIIEISNKEYADLNPFIELIVVDIL